MIDTKKIDESIIPMNFSWRAGIATQQGALRVIDNPKIDSVTGNPKYDHEYYESLWYELTAEIDEELTSFYLFNRMCSETYSMIDSSIKACIRNFEYRYPAMKSAGFVQYLKDLRMETYQMLMQKLSSEYHDYGYIPVKTVDECELIYVDDQFNRVIINTPKLIDYIIETYENSYTK